MRTETAPASVYLPNPNLETDENSVFSALLCFAPQLRPATAQPANYAFDPNRIYPDSKLEGHGGTAAWAMKSRRRIAPAEQLSMPRQNNDGLDAGHCPFRTVPQFTRIHKVYPEPYYGVNNKLDSNLIPDLSSGPIFTPIGSVPNLRSRKVTRTNGSDAARRNQLPRRGVAQRQPARYDGRHVQG